MQNKHLCQEIWALLTKEVLTFSVFPESYWKATIIKFSILIFLHFRTQKVFARHLGKFQLKFKKWISRISSQWNFKFVAWYVLFYIPRYNLPRSYVKSGSRSSFNKQTPQLLLKKKELSRKERRLEDKPLFLIAWAEKSNKYAAHLN